MSLNPHKSRKSEILWILIECSPKPMAWHLASLFHCIKDMFSRLVSDATSGRIPSSGAEYSIIYTARLWPANVSQRHLFNLGGLLLLYIGIGMRKSMMNGMTKAAIQASLNDDRGLDGFSSMATSIDCCLPPSHTVGCSGSSIQVCFPSQQSRPKFRISLVLVIWGERPAVCLSAASPLAASRSPNSVPERFQTRPGALLLTLCNWHHSSLRINSDQLSSRFYSFDDIFD
jgi:hypothetical protein